MKATENMDNSLPKYQAFVKCMASCSRDVFLGYNKRDIDYNINDSNKLFSCSDGYMIDLNTFISCDEFKAGEVIIVNVSGLRFKIIDEVLLKFPLTLLGDKVKRSRYYDSVHEEYFFDRNRPSFFGILYYYASGILKRPFNAPFDVFNDEIEFYQIDDNTIRYHLESEKKVMKMSQNHPPTNVGSRILHHSRHDKSSFTISSKVLLSYVIVLILLFIISYDTIFGVRSPTIR